MLSFRRIAALLLALALTLALCACGSTETNDRRASNEIVVGISQDLDDSLDPHKTVAAGTKEFLFNVFEGLVKPTPDGELIPAVAESFTVSDDQLTYRFTLREGITFHNGAPATAEDVKWSVEHCRDTGFVPALAEVESVSCEDARTVAIRLSQQDSEFLSYLTLAILPRDYTQQDTAPVGTGPFRYVSRTAQQNLVLERYDGYWGEKAKLSRVTYQIFENADSLVLALKSGAVDLYAHLSPVQTAQLSADRFDILEGTMNLVQAVYLNNAVAPLDNETVRQALCCALNREEVFAIVADGHGTALGSSVYPAFRKYFRDDLTDYYTYDPEKARTLLAQAGYPDGFDLTITVPSNYTTHMDTAQVVAEQFRKIGVNVTIEPVEWTSWLSDVYQSRNYQATVVGIDASNMTARALLERYTSASPKNFINYHNDDYDAAFARALAASDDDARTEAYLEMEEILTKTAANVYIQDNCDLVAIRKGLSGYRFYPIYVMDMSTVFYN